MTRPVHTLSSLMLDPKILAAASEETFEGIDPRDHRTAFDPCDGWLSDPDQDRQLPLGEAGLKSATSQYRGNVHGAMITFLISRPRAYSAPNSRTFSLTLVRPAPQKPRRLAALRETSMIVSLSP